MNVIEMDVAKIKPYDKNPRKNDRAVGGVAESIKQFGFQQPLVIDKDNVIIVGHTRYKAAQELGLSTVPCVRADELTKEQVKAYRIADNKLNELAMWDMELLDDELKTFEFDFTPFGFVIPKSAPPVQNFEVAPPVSPMDTWMNSELQGSNSPEQEHDSIRITPDNPYEDTQDDQDSPLAVEDAGGSKAQVYSLKFKEYTFPMSSEEEIAFEKVYTAYYKEHGTFDGFVREIFKYEIH